MRYLSLYSAVIWIAACGSTRDQHPNAQSRLTSGAEPAPSEFGRIPCNEPDPRGDWLDHTPAYERGDDPARFADSFRTVGDRVTLWLDTAFARTERAIRWIGADSISTTLRPHELLAQACALTGTAHDGRIVAL